MSARLLLLVEIFSLRVLHFPAQDFLFESRRVCVALDLISIPVGDVESVAVLVPVVEVESPCEAGQGKGVLK
jgi:hypothetical protein